MSHSVDAYDFLSHQTTIKSLLLAPTIKDAQGGIAADKSLRNSITLPCLEIFVGPAASASRVISGSRARSALFFWSPKDDPKVIVQGLPRSIKELDNVVLTWDGIQKLMVALAEHHPDLQALRFNGMGRRIWDTDVDVS